MKKSILIIIMSWTFAISAYAQNDTTTTSIRGTFFGDVISKNIQQINGSFNFNVWYKFIDTTIIERNPTVVVPENWNLTYTDIRNNIYYPGDSIIWTITITYPTSNIPFYPQEIYINQLTNQIVSVEDTVLQELGVTAMVYFTPYNSIEVWSLSDFQSLNRNWLYSDNNPNAQRIYVDQSSIPSSNLDTYTIDWDSGDWENDWQDDFREIKVDGLAYTILMKPVPPDSMYYYEQIGDGADSVNERKTFTGRVIGYLKAQYINDFGDIITYPLTGIRVKLMEKDLIWNETFATGYTDANGYFDLSYSKNQVFEGNNVELFLRFKSRTSDNYKISSTNFIGSNYKHETSEWGAPQNAGTMNRGDISMVGDSKFYYDAFRAVHWGNLGYKYFDNNNISLGEKLRFNINASGSWYNPYNLTATINLTDDNANYENTPYHEFGHHTMFRLQNNNFTMPYGENGFSHSWSQENTSQLAWVEGWGDFIGMVLDAAYYTEDGEYGYDEFRVDPFEARSHYSWPNSWNITKGFRSEYYFACALYDLWDGPNKGLPETMPYRTYHGWNETGQTGSGWATIDDVEFNFNVLCQPLIQHPSGSGKIKNPEEYIDYLIGIVNNCESTADISRTLQENRVQWNVHEYEWGWHNSNFNTDDLGLTESVHEDPSFPGPQYTDYYDVTIYNKNSVNDFSLNTGSQSTHCLTDNIYMGIWDTYSNVYKTLNVHLNSANQGFEHRVFNTYGKNRIYVSNGELELGGVSTSAELNLGSESLLWNGSHGKLVINDGSTLHVQAGATLRLSGNSRTEVYGSGNIVVDNGGYICIEPGAVILLSAASSNITINDQSIIGTNPELETTLSSNCQMPSEIVYDGEGEIIFNCFAFVTGYTHENVVIINSNTIWNQVNYRLKKGIVINQPATLTISNNSQVEFSANAGIIVKQGANLEIDNSVLTNLHECNISWPGVQVWGDKLESQYCSTGNICTQGRLIINSSVIENAIVAIDLWNPDHWETTGGMVYATDATFRNNGKSVHALYYRNFVPNDPTKEWPYFSNFENCTFEINQDYLGDVTFYKHVDLSHVKGIDFQGCDFTLAENVAGVSEWNHAIAGYNAQFTASAFCPLPYSPCPEENYDKCTFTGFYNGISAVNDGSSTVTFNVNRGIFSNSVYGVKTLSMNNATVLSSDFGIGHLWECGAGIYADNVTGFAFEENDFSKFPGGPVSNYFGIIINNSEAVNEVYKNNFSDLSYANFADGKNWVGKDRYQGLAYYCNENQNNYADFYVADKEQNGSSYSGIGSFQGDDNHMAGNTFTQNAATWHFYNGGEHLVGYYYNQNNSLEVPDISKIYQVAIVPKSITNTCPSHYGGNSNLQLVLNTQQKLDAELKYYDNLSDYNSIKSLYDSYVDGGSTASELSDIQSAQPDDMWTLRAQLLGDSPHLSLEVLKEVADRTDVFTESALFDILAANPDELKKDTLISYLENKEDPLPEYMINILMQLAEGVTYKTVLQQQMSFYKQEYTRAAHEIIRSYLNDTISDYVELRNWLDNLGGITSDRQIISTYVSEGNFTNALSLANMLPQLYNLEGDELVEHGYYMDMLNLYETLNQQGRNTYQLTSTEKSSIEFMAENSKGIAGAQAKSIMEAVYDVYYTDCPNADGVAGYKQSGMISPGELGKAYGLNISVKPNPANQWAAFNYTLPVGQTSGVIIITDVAGHTIEVLDVTGQQGQKLWDTRTLSPGVYFYTLTSAGFNQSGKIVVSN